MKNIIYILLSILICIASFFILHHGKKNVTETPKTIIDSFVVNASFTEYNSDGQLKTKVTAEKVTHFQPEGTSVFLKPFIITYTSDRTPWHIRADKGSSDKTGEKIILQGHVVAHELPTLKDAGATITTSELTLFPKQSRAFTKKPVTLLRPGTTIHGTGFNANLKTGVYQLLSEASAVYQPEESKKK